MFDLPCPLVFLAEPIFGWLRLLRLAGVKMRNCAAINRNGHGMPLHRHTMTKMSLEQIPFRIPFHPPNPWLQLLSDGDCLFCQ